MEITRFGPLRRPSGWQKARTSPPTSFDAKVRGSLARKMSATSSAAAFATATFIRPSTRIELASSYAFQSQFPTEPPDCLRVLRRTGPRPPPSSRDRESANQLPLPVGSCWAVRLRVLHHVHGSGLQGSLALLLGLSWATSETG